MTTQNDEPTKQQEPSLMDVVEHRARPNLNRTLSIERKREILLPGILDEGSAWIDPILQVGMAIIEGRDGALQCLDIHFNRAVSRDGGRSWGEYSTIGDLASQATFGGRDKSLFGFGWTRLASGTIGAGWIDRGITEHGHPYTHLWWRTSDDEGQTWSDDVAINPTGEMGSPSHLNPTLVTASGRLIVPARMCFSANLQTYETGRAIGWWKNEPVACEGHNHYPEIDITHVFYSDDEGRTWHRAEGDIFGWLHRGWLNCVAFDEPAVEELADGRLLLVGRSTVGRLLYSLSEDHGEHWSIVEPLPLASSYAPAALSKIPGTGDILCVWNQASPDEIRGGHARARLSAAITCDGSTWKHFRTLERHGRIAPADRIEPDDSLVVCRALDDIGDIPEDRGVSDYATIGFHEDNVIVMYPQCKGIGHDLVSAMKIRVLPLSWFYAAP